LREAAGAGVAVLRVLAAAFRVGLALFVDFADGRFRADVCAARARAAGFRAFLATFAATRRLDALCLRLAAFLAVFLAAAWRRFATFRAPPFRLPACLERGRAVRAAFRLAMARPFSYLDCFR
jgi:hypothetical protein